MFPSRPPVKLPTTSTPAAFFLTHHLANSSDKLHRLQRAQRGGGLLVDSVRLSRQSSSLGRSRPRLNISGSPASSPPLLRRPYIPHTMAARLPVSQVPAMFARRQPRVLSITKREFPGDPPYNLSPQGPHYRTNASESERYIKDQDLGLTQCFYRPPIFLRPSNPEPRLPALPLRHPTPPREEHPRIRSLQDPGLRSEGPSSERRCPRLPGPNCLRVPGQPSRRPRQAHPP